LIAKHTKANSCGEKTEKPGHRALLRKRFTFMVLTVTPPRTPRDSIRSSSADIGQRVFGDSHELLCSCDSAFHQMYVRRIAAAEFERSREMART
jgi:hypothetical protein